MGEPAANEPTMEEILASIRQIIAEEGQGAGEPVRAGEPDAGVDLPENMISLESSNMPETGSGQHARDMNEEGTEPMAQGDFETAHTSSQELQNHRHVDLDEGMIERRTMAGPTKAAMLEEEKRPVHDADDKDTERFRGALMSRSADQAVHASFEKLKSSFTETMDEKTEKMLRPMLQQWLDENLPTLVERLVREEIERVARGE